MFECEICFFKSDRRYNLNRHVETCHSELREKKECCGEDFRTKYDYYLHYEERHKIFRNIRMSPRRPTVSQPSTSGNIRRESVLKMNNREKFPTNPKIVRSFQISSTSKMVEFGNKINQHEKTKASGSQSNFASSSMKNNLISTKSYKRFHLFKIVRTADDTSLGENSLKIETKASTSIEFNRSHEQKINIKTTKKSSTICSGKACGKENCPNRLYKFYRVLNPDNDINVASNIPKILTPVVSPRKISILRRIMLENRKNTEQPKKLQFICNINGETKIRTGYLKKIPISPSEMEKNKLHCNAREKIDLKNCQMIRISPIIPVKLIRCSNVMVRFDPRIPLPRLTERQRSYLEGIDFNQLNENQ